MSLNSKESTISQPSRINHRPESNKGIVFMGGYGYDYLRNIEVGNTIMNLAGYTETIVIPDEPFASKHGSVIHKFADSNDMVLPGKLALKNMDSDKSTVRYTQLHADRARRLIQEIESRGGEPVDAVFQSVDVSTGLIAIKERPELFDRVVLLDPSSIIKHPSRKRYLIDAWKNRELAKQLSRRASTEELDSSENRPTVFRRFMRSKRSSYNGNFIAAFISSQATMLHEIAQHKSGQHIDVIASQFDHAYDPIKIIQSLISVDDVNGFFVTNMRHGLAGKQLKLEQLVSVLKSVADNETVVVKRLHFFKGVTEEYRRQIIAAFQDKVK